MKYFAVYLCINVAVTGITISNCIRFIFFLNLYAFGNLVIGVGGAVAEVEELELTSPITQEVLELEFVSMYTYEFTM